MSAFDLLLAEARRAHAAIPALAEFCAFPDDLTPQAVKRRWSPVQDLLMAQAWSAGDLDAFRDAWIMAAHEAAWRETYKDTNIGEDFLNRFGCYCLVGDGGAFKSEKMAAYVVYMPPNLHYPWHEHPAEEMYVVLAGQATFRREGEKDEVLTAGGTSFHASNQPHAMTTGDHPVMAYVVWRNEFGTPPILTDRIIR